MSFCFSQQEVSLKTDSRLIDDCILIFQAL